MSHFLAQSAKKIAVSVAAVCAEYILTDLINHDRHQNESDEQEPDEKGKFSNG